MGTTNGIARLGTRAIGGPAAMARQGLKSPAYSNELPTGLLAEPWKGCVGVGRRHQSLPGRRSRIPIGRLSKPVALTPVRGPYPMSRDEALALLHVYTDSPSLRKHAYAVEAAMRCYA